MALTAQLDEARTARLLRACAHAPDETARVDAARELVSYVWETGVAEAWAVNLTRRHSAAIDIEEMQQVVAEGIMSRALKITSTEYGKLVKPSAHLWFAAKRAGEAYCDSGAVTLAGQMTGVSRRYRRAQKARQDYVAEFGAAPSTSELVEWANARTYASVADPVKSGLLLTSEDVEGTLISGHSLSNDETSTTRSRLVSPDRAERSAELALTVVQIVELIAQMYEDPRVARGAAVAFDAWVDLVAAGETPTLAALARELGCSRARAAEHDAVIQQVLQAYRERHDP